MKPFFKRLLIGSVITALLASVLFAPLRMWTSIGPPIFVINLLVLALVLRRRLDSSWSPVKQNLICVATGAAVIATLWVYTLTIPRLFPGPQERYRAFVLEQEQLR